MARPSAPADDFQARRMLGRLGENLLELRRLSGRSQVEVAIYADIHRTEVSMLERGGRMPGLDTVLKVAAGVDADPAALLDGLYWTLDPGRFQIPPRGHFSIDGKEVGRP
ncbi:MAG TPA: helix-turn-helix transcriptional regulator [Solirubrobacterales bacterium]|jgi:transcriptional regulator with XRE-family HTH domain